MKRRRVPHKNRIGGQWSPRLIKMLESPAYRALSLSAHRIISRTEIELAKHGGNDNGRLPLTKQDFIAYGVSPRLVAPTTREAEALGFIRVTHGRGGNSEHRKPNLFGVTFAHSPNSHVEPATHDWRNIKTIEEAIAVAQAARADKSKTAVAMGKRAARKNRNRVHKVVPGPGTQSGPETPDFRVHKVVPKQQNSRVHKVVLLSRQLAKSSEGCASSCPADEPRQPAAQPQNNDPWADLGIPEFLRRYS